METDLKSHWESKYSQTETSRLGWYEADPQPSLELIIQCDIPKDGIVLDVGSGASSLVDSLVLEGYTQVISTDISEEGLKITQHRLGEKVAQVQFIVDDIAHSKVIVQLKDVSMWHDRAVLHFFTEEKDRKAYLKLLKQVLKPGGIAIISTFAVGGLTHCSGLDIRQYDIQSLSKFLGDEFTLIKGIHYTYTTTWGQERPFIYGVFQRVVNPS